MFVVKSTYLYKEIKLLIEAIIPNTQIDIGNITIYFEILKLKCKSINNPATAPS